MLIYGLGNHFYFHFCVAIWELIYGTPRICDPCIWEFSFDFGVLDFEGSLDLLGVLGLDPTLPDLDLDLGVDFDLNGLDGRSGCVLFLFDPLDDRLEMCGSVAGCCGVMPVTWEKWRSPLVPILFELETVKRKWSPRDACWLHCWWCSTRNRPHCQHTRRIWMLWIGVTWKWWWLNRNG